MKQIDKKRKDAIIDQLSSFIDIDSTTGNEATLLTRLEEEFNRRGFICERQNVAYNRWNLLAVFPSKSYDSDDLQFMRPQILFSTHIDCVPPFIPSSLGTVDGEIAIFGRGACDTKGGLVAMLSAAQELIQHGFEQLAFLLVVGEEVDHCGAITAGSMHGASKAFEDSLSQLKQIILCEPTTNLVVHAQKGLLKLRLSASGVAAHSAYPKRGVSAIDKLLTLLEKWRHLDLPQNDTLGPTTMNIGLIGGGVAANVFAPSAYAEVLVRAVSPVDQLLETFNNENDGSVNVEVVSKNDPIFFEPPEDFDTTNIAFNTDASYLQSLGNVWLVGPGDIQIAHSDKEHITLRNIIDGTELYIKLAKLSFNNDM